MTYIQFKFFIRDIRMALWIRLLSISQFLKLKFMWDFTINRCFVQNFRDLKIILYDRDRDRECELYGYVITRQNIQCTSSFINFDGSWMKKPICLIPQLNIDWMSKILCCPTKRDFVWNVDRQGEIPLHGCEGIVKSDVFCNQDFCKIENQYFTSACTIFFISRIDFQVTFLIVHVEHLHKLTQRKRERKRGHSDVSVWYQDNLGSKNC